MYCLHVTQLLTLNFPLNKMSGLDVPEFKLILIKIYIVVVSTDRKTKQKQHEFFECVF